VFTNNFFDLDDVEQIRGDVPAALNSLKKQNKRKKRFVIGGPDLLIQSKPVLEKIYITRIPGEYLHDVRLDVDEFLQGTVLHQTINLGSCLIEEYHNETISSSTKSRPKPGCTQS
jgi:dihydrofolate reductase